MVGEEINKKVVVVGSGTKPGTDGIGDCGRALEEGWIRGGATLEEKTW